MSDEGTHVKDLPRRKHAFYVLHLWRERQATSDSCPAWRISLEEARGGERHGFASLEALMAFLQAEMMKETDASHPEIAE